MNRKPGPILQLRSLLFACAVSLPADAAENGGRMPDPWHACASQVIEAERKAGLPPYLLNAIAKVESGRWSPGSQAVLAWPWTVMAEGRGRFLPSRAAAVAEVEALRARGVTNIDVGCMQINLRYHSKAFDSLETAFEPRRNVAYAAAYLGRLKAEAGSWTVAIGRYHSRTPRLSGAYRLKVFRAWRAERHLANRVRIAAREAAPGQPASRSPGFGWLVGAAGASSAAVRPTTPGAMLRAGGL